jgi:hypothetical protein
VSVTCLVFFFSPKLYQNKWEELNDIFLHMNLYFDRKIISKRINNRRCCYCIHDLQILLTVLINFSLSPSVCQHKTKCRQCNHRLRYLLSCNCTRHHPHYYIVHCDSNKLSSGLLYTYNCPMHDIESVLYLSTQYLI